MSCSIRVYLGGPKGAYKQKHKVRKGAWGWMGRHETSQVITCPASKESIWAPLGKIHQRKAMWLAGPFESQGRLAWPHKKVAIKTLNKGGAYPGTPIRLLFLNWWKFRWLLIRFLDKDWKKRIFNIIECGRQSYQLRYCYPILGVIPRKCMELFLGKI